MLRCLRRSALSSFCLENIKSLNDRLAFFKFCEDNHDFLLMRETAKDILNICGNIEEEVLNKISLYERLDKVEADKAACSHICVGEGFVEIEIPDILPLKAQVNAARKRLWAGYFQSVSKETGLPLFDHAKITIEIHSCKNNWDLDNRAFGMVINFLKGMIIKNDSCGHVISVELVARISDEYKTKIVVSKIA